MYAVKIAFCLVLFALVNELVVGEFTAKIVGPHYVYNYDKDKINARVRRSPEGTASLSGRNTNGVTSLRGDLSRTLVETDRGTLDGNAYYQRNWGLAPKYETGAGLNFDHISGFRGSVNYDKNPYSSTLGGRFGYDFYRSDSGNTKIGADGFYNKHFGEYGSRQDYGVGVSLRHNF